MHARTHARLSAYLLTCCMMHCEHLLVVKLTIVWASVSGSRSLINTVLHSHVPYQYSSAFSCSLSIQFCILMFLINTVLTFSCSLSIQFCILMFLINTVLHSHVPYQYSSAFSCSLSIQFCILMFLINTSSAFSCSLSIQFCILMFLINTVLHSHVPYQYSSAFSCSLSIQFCILMFLVNRPGRRERRKGLAGGREEFGFFFFFFFSNRQPSVQVRSSVIDNRPSRSDLQ